MLNLELQRSFGLRAEEHQIFLLIVLSTVQRFARDRGRDARFLDSTPLPAKTAGSISRRRISETLDIPLETVRRTVAGLLARGTLVERRRGCLSTSRRDARTPRRRCAARAHGAAVSEYKQQDGEAWRGPACRDRNHDITQHHRFRRQFRPRGATLPLGVRCRVRSEAVFMEMGW
jgi:hypothetical protein